MNQGRVSDPTNAERQRRYRRRHKLGLEPVKVRGVVYLVPPELAARIASMCDVADTLERAGVTRD